MNASEERNRRLIVANVALATFSPATITKWRLYWAVSWPNSIGGETVRRWSVSNGSNFYPPWHSIFPGGGTSITAMAQLMRWLHGHPVLPIATWYYWSGDSVSLLPGSAVDALFDEGYPESVLCVLCARILTTRTGIDWWRLDGLSGPSCSARKPGGCRQRRDGVPIPTTRNPSEDS